MGRRENGELEGQILRRTELRLRSVMDVGGKWGNGKSGKPAIADGGRRLGRVLALGERCGFLVLDLL